MLKRVITGVVALAITLACLLWTEPWGAWGLILVVFACGSIEIARLTKSSVLWPVVFGVLCLSSWVIRSTDGVLFALILWLLGGYGLFVWQPNEKHSSFKPSIWLCAGCYSALALASLHLTISSVSVMSALLLSLVPLWIGDSLAYFVGSKFGKHKMAPKLSPHKSWEGALANLGGCLFASWFLVASIGGPPALGIALGLTTGIFGQMGDLLQSRFKRLLGAKDSGSLLPGHGGVLDRVDSFLFSAPPSLLALYYIVPTLFHVKQ